jgi:anti-sigma factor RsiW
MRFPRFLRRADPLACREFVELVTDFLDGALPPDTQARFEAHLAECDGCAGYLADMRAIAATGPTVELPATDPATREALVAAFRDARR